MAVVQRSKPSFCVVAAITEGLLESEDKVSDSVVGETSLFNKWYSPGFTSPTPIVC